MNIGFRAAALAAGLLAGLSAATAPAQQAGCAPDLVTALTGDGPVTFTVEIADDNAERARGLMFRQQMDADRGMIFFYTEEAPRFFWMKNTYLPLDIVFFDAAGKVVHVAADAVPFSERTVSSRKPAFGALEINAGLAAANGIEPGTMLVHPAFADNAPPEFRCE